MDILEKDLQSISPFPSTSSTSSHLARLDDATKHSIFSIFGGKQKEGSSVPTTPTIAMNTKSEDAKRVKESSLNRIPSMSSDAVLDNQVVPLLMDCFNDSPRRDVSSETFKSFPTSAQPAKEEKVPGLISVDGDPDGTIICDPGMQIDESQTDFPATIPPYRDDILDSIQLDNPDCLEEIPVAFDADLNIPFSEVFDSKRELGFMPRAERQSWEEEEELEEQHRRNHGHSYSHSNEGPIPFPPRSAGPEPVQQRTGPMTSFFSTLSAPFDLSRYIIPRLNFSLNPEWGATPSPWSPHPHYGAPISRRRASSDDGSAGSVQTAVTNASGNSATSVTSSGANNNLKRTAPDDQFPSNVTSLNKKLAEVNEHEDLMNVPPHHRAGVPYPQHQRMNPGVQSGPAVYDPSVRKQFQPVSHTKTHFQETSPGSATINGEQSSEVKKPPLVGEHRLKINFISLGNLGEIPQHFGKKRSRIPDGLSGTHELYNQKWLFEVTHRKADANVITVHWKIVNLASGTTTERLETTHEAFIREYKGQTICNQVLRDALDTRAKELEILNQKEHSPRSSASIQNSLRALRPRKCIMGLLFFGLLHQTVQENLNRQFEARQQQAAAASTSTSSSNVSTSQGAYPALGQPPLGPSTAVTTSEDHNEADQ